jgi:hypothetical protein
LLFGESTGKYRKSNVRFLEVGSGALTSTETFGGAFLGILVAFSGDSSRVQLCLAGQATADCQAVVDLGEFRAESGIREVPERSIFDRFSAKFGPERLVSRCRLHPKIAS